MPEDLVGSLSVEDEAVGTGLGLPHLTGHIVASAELVDESLTLVGQQQTANTAESLGGKELHLWITNTGTTEEEDDSRKMHERTKHNRGEARDTKSVEEEQAERGDKKEGRSVIVADSNLASLENQQDMMMTTVGANEC